MNIHSNGDNNRFAGRDYHEHRPEIREDEPEWKPPPYNSGLILCPGCKRRHIARNAIACTRCGYPQREVMQEEHRRSLLRINHEQAKRQAYGVFSGTGGLLVGLFHYDLVGIYLIALWILSGILGYIALPVLEASVRDWLSDRR
ncbi:hypothetical protein [Pinirhizobacter sp.]|jgi:hypothetical protein|uniref:hypothetical protein n=1 Tax=Pinirhizobacter sp. TaxID=2950432 RepID=UPI002F410E8C